MATARLGLAWVAVLGTALLATACRGSRLLGPTPGQPTGAAKPSAPTPTAAERARLAERGAAPGGNDGRGGFVARGSARNFYAGAGGRLWYYLNNYYWVPADLPVEGLWIRAEVRADFVDLLRWPERTSLASPPTKTTVEYWAVGPEGRSVRLDNHKDYVLLDPKTCAGRVKVEVTLTLGRLRVADEKGTWAAPTEGYVLERRNYRDDHPPGIGAERTRFEPLADRPTTTWDYVIPWATGASPLTRSSWQDLDVPAWRLSEARLDVAPSHEGPTSSRAPEPPVITPREPAAPEGPGAPPPSNGP
jgi:hypothetical protein